MIVKCSCCRKEFPISNFHNNRFKKNGKDHICKSCRNMRNIQQKQCKYNHNKVLRKKRKKILEKIAFSSYCAVCGKPIKKGQQYNFHHWIPEERRFGLSGYCGSDEVFEKELAKCSPLHVRCHSRLHTCMRRSKKKNTDAIKLKYNSANKTFIISSIDMVDMMSMFEYCSFIQSKEDKYSGTISLPLRIKDEN